MPTIQSSYLSVRQTSAPNGASTAFTHSGNWPAQAFRSTEVASISLFQPNTMARCPSSKAMASARSAMRTAPASRPSWKGQARPLGRGDLLACMIAAVDKPIPLGSRPLLFTYRSGLKRVDEAGMQVWFTRKRPKPVRREGLRAGNYAFVKRRPAQGNGVSR